MTTPSSSEAGPEETGTPSSPATTLAGNPGWSDTFGTSQLGSFEQVDDIAADATGVYVAAEVSKHLDGLPHHGDWDIVIRKYTTDGTVVWTKEIGTPRRDINGHVALDGAGHLYVSGQDGRGIPQLREPQRSGRIPPQVRPRRERDLDAGSSGPRAKRTSSARRPTPTASISAGTRGCPSDLPRRRSRPRTRSS
jgi:hypothetical protein